MGKRGPCKKPTALRIFEGNPSRRPLNTREPKPTLGVPVCPEWLDTEARAEWERIVPELKRLGMLATIDRAELSAYCQSWSEYVAATKLVREQGTIVVSKQGTQKNPNCAVQNEAWARFHKTAIMFGLNPSSRSTMVAPGVSKGGKLEAFLSKKMG